MLSKCLLNADRVGASTTSLGSLSQCLTTPSVKKCFLLSSLNLPWCSFESFARVLPLDPREKSSAPPSPRPLLRKLQRAVRLPLGLLLSKPRVLSRSSQDMPSSPSTSFAAFLWMHSRTFMCCLNHGAQNCRQCSRWGRTTLNAAGWAPLLAVWPCCVWCTPGRRGLPSAKGCQGTLLAHTEPAVSQHPQVPRCRAALQPLPLPVCTCVPVTLKQQVAWKEQEIAETSRTCIIVVLLLMSSMAMRL